MSVPVTWSELVNDRFPYLDGRLKGLARPVKRLPSSPDAFRGISSLLAETVAARGVAAAQPYFELAQPAALQALEQVTTDVEAAAMIVDGALWFINLAQTAGSDLAGAFGSAQAAWLSEMAAVERDGLLRQSLAFSALAFGQDELVRQFVGPAPAGAAPGLTFQFNYPALIAYLSAACVRGASYEDVRPAWIDFLRSFPYKMGAKTAEWPHIFCVGRAVYHRIRDLPVSGVARETHKQIMQLVSQGH